MSNHKTRLEKLEQRAVDQTAVHITEIQIHKQDEDGDETIECIKIVQLDQNGDEVVSVTLPKNGRDLLEPSESG